MAAPKSLDDMLKEGLLLKGDDKRLEVIRVPIGIPALDTLLGGGMPRGRAIEEYGPESTGKTLLAQYAVAAVQKTEFPMALYMDMERSYDKGWWEQSGVDTSKILVSTPTTAEQAIDIMKAMLESSSELGIIVLDSIGAMTPEPEMDPEKSSSDKTIGLQARVVTLMYHKIIPLLKNTIFLATNQMRDSIGMPNELGALPGGRAQRHYSHIILRTARESWINEKVGNETVHKGFYMEIISKKNKLSDVPDGSSINLPFMFKGQVDMLTKYIEDSIKQKYISRAGPYYKVAGQSFLGMDNLRQFYVENPNELEQLKTSLG